MPPKKSKGEPKNEAPATPKKEQAPKAEANAEARPQTAESGKKASKNEKSQDNKKTSKKEEPKQAWAEPAPESGAESQGAEKKERKQPVSIPVPAGQRKDKVKAAKSDAQMLAKAQAQKEKKEDGAEGEEKSKKAGKPGKEKKEEKKFVNTTPAGQMKSFADPMADNYQPDAVEAAWNEYWKQAGLYKPDLNSDAEKFVMVMPPPNVTGNLHIGHALTLSIEDSLTRWHRMSGRNVLWVPGTDHAGIATQVVVEKKLVKEQKKSRHDLGREKFLEEVWKWKASSASHIYDQTSRMGASCDWSRERFTMDEMCSKAVIEAFIRMYNDGKIYRANRLVNWSCTLQSAISTVEVDYKELKGIEQLKVPGYDEKVEFGVIHSFAYPIKGGKPGEELVVATTRIETMLGDVAVAVHPDDKRYKSLVGKELVHPFLPDRKMIVIADTMVDPAYGSGAVKITPAHDPNDFACGQRHNLPQINLFTDDGLINENGGPFKGQPRFKARVEVLKALAEKGLYKGKAPNPMSLGICSRSGDIVEPVIRPQWWVDCKEMADRAVQETKKGNLTIIPEAKEKIWFGWLENIQDWCISRQLWWGHRIPAYYVTIDGKPATNDDNNNWVVAHNEEEALKLAAAKYKKPANKIKLSQDPDVLDTWFSSGLFPFMTLGWPEKTPDFEKFYPGSLLETGNDILFFWVARMVMMGLQLTNNLPFKTVYLHSMVRDKLGRKMSKSKGNVVDPLDVINGITLKMLHTKLENGNLDPAELIRAKELQSIDFPEGIPACGADALRFGLLAYTSQGKDINLDVMRVVAYRAFCNKLWNATRFTLQNFPADFEPPADLKAVDALVKKSGRFADKWILSRLARAVQACDNGFKNYEFATATSATNVFWIADLCDRYLELTKRVVYDKPAEGGKESKEVAEKRAADQAAVRAVLFTCLDMGLKLLHPMMPFVTEELYHRLPGWAKLKEKRGDSGSIMIAKYPTPDMVSHWLNDKVEADMETLSTIAHASRSSRSALGLTTKRVDLNVLCGTKELYELVKNNAADLTVIAFASSIVPLNRGEKPPVGCASTVLSPDLELHMPLAGLVDFSTEVLKMEKQAKLLVASMAGLEVAMSDPNWAKNVKPAVQQQQKEKVAATKESLAKIEQSIAQFKSYMTPEQFRGYQKDKTAELRKDLKKAEESVERNTPKDAEAAAKMSKKAQKSLEDAIKERDSIAAQLAELTLQIDAKYPVELTLTKGVEKLCRSCNKTIATGDSAAVLTFAEGHSRSVHGYETVFYQHAACFTSKPVVPTATGTTEAAPVLLLKSIKGDKAKTELAAAIKSAESAETASKAAAPAASSGATETKNASTEESKKDNKKDKKKGGEKETKDAAPQQPKQEEKPKENKKDKSKKDDKAAQSKEEAKPKEDKSKQDNKKQSKGKKESGKKA